MKWINFLVLNSLPRFLFLALLAWLLHFLALSLIFPGYYTPLAFHHSDFYIPASFVYAPGDGYSYSNLLHWPRPLFMWFYKFTGYFGFAGSVAWVVGIVFFNAVLSASFARRLLGLNFDWRFILFFALYCFLLFTQPYFYTFYSQDIGSQLSYLVLLSGCFIFVLINKQQLLIASFLLFVASSCALLIKETYFLAFGFLCLGWVAYNFRQNIIYSLAPGLAILAGGIVSALVNLKTNSVFVNLNAETGTSYHMNLDIFSVMKELLRYAKQGVTPAVFLAFMVVIYQLHKFYKNSWLSFSAVACLGFAIFSWVPNALLPNHHYEGYSFNGLYVCFLLVFFALKMIQDKALSKPVLISILVLLVLSPMTSLKKYQGTRNTWVLAMEQAQKNILAGFSRATAGLEKNEGQINVLVSGITSPFHPFVFPQSIRAFPHGEKAQYFFMVPKEYPNNLGQKIDLVQFIAEADLVNYHYDQEWKFDDKGNLIDIIKK